MTSFKDVFRRIYIFVELAAGLFELVDLSCSEML
jgi:hypothetical protein